MLMWAMDKFINPAHSAKVFANFYAFSGLGSSVVAGAGGIELVVLAGFVLGIYKNGRTALSCSFMLYPHSHPISNICRRLKGRICCFFARLAVAGKLLYAIPVAR